MKRSTLYLVAVTGAAAIVISALSRRGPSGFSYGSTIKNRAGLDIDPSHLDPSFARSLETVFRRMRERGFDPILREGYRTPARAKALSEKNPKGANELSTHIYGLGADIISASKLYNAPKEFWTALGEEVEDAGLVWGGRFSNEDRVHVQAVRPAEEYLVRHLDPVDRATYVRERLA
jgi:hypothetical protein